MRHEPVALVRAELDLLDAALAGDDALASALGHQVVPGWAPERETLKPLRDFVAAAPGGAAWGPRLFLYGRPPALVGWGGFKGPPQGGTVEIGYGIAESHRDRGIATAAVRSILREAFAAPEVTQVVAHTLPHGNASNHILEKMGFQYAGDVREDGERVWCFTLARD